MHYYWKNFKDKEDLAVDLTLTDEPTESMVIATPFEKPAHFYYNRKIIGFKAQGKVKLGGKTLLSFEKSDARGLLDWGRGVWTYKNTWVWGAFMTKIGDHEVGINLGYGFGDTSRATENMIFYDGKAHKLEHVSVDFNNIKKDDYTFPFKITSSDGRLEADFVPIIDRKANTNALIISSNQHQVFGLLTGKIILDNGQVVELNEVYGFIEKVQNKW